MAWLLAMALFLLFSTLASSDHEPGYMSNSQLEASLKGLAKTCNISRLYSIGKSTMGFPLWVLEISDMPGVPEPKPAFKYVGNMHGDEPLGRELLLHLANWLCSNYLKDPLATLIVKNVHLHLLPSMNPDGFRLGRRTNGNNIDLNRDFPDQFFPQNNDEKRRQLETRAIMSWIRSNNFVASASLHEGALVANYPWDGTQNSRTNYSACPDDSAFRFLASLYSQFHGSMSHSKEFLQGITNGAAWYPLYGGMQDWNYIHGNCLDLTLEISEEKWPPISQISSIWEQNKLSMLELVASLVKSGLHGRVISSSEGQPLPATISVVGTGLNVTAGPRFGDYHRLLRPGRNYEVVATMQGYKTSKFNIFVPEGHATCLDFILDPVASENKEEKRLGRMGSGTRANAIPRNSCLILDGNGSEGRSSEHFLEVVEKKRGYNYYYGDDAIMEMMFEHLQSGIIFFTMALVLLILFAMLRWRRKAAYAPPKFRKPINV